MLHPTCHGFTLHLICSPHSCELCHQLSGPPPQVLAAVCLGCCLGACGAGLLTCRRKLVLCAVILALQGRQPALCGSERRALRLQLLLLRRSLRLQCRQAGQPGIQQLLQPRRLVCCVRLGSLQLLGQLLGLQPSKDGSGPSKQSRSSR